MAFCYNSPNRLRQGCRIMEAFCSFPLSCPTLSSLLQNSLGFRLALSSSSSVVSLGGGYSRGGYNGSHNDVVVLFPSQNFWHDDDNVCFVVLLLLFVRLLVYIYESLSIFPSSCHAPPFSFYASLVSGV